MEEDIGRSARSTPSPSRPPNPFQTPIKRSHQGCPKTTTRSPVRSPVTLSKYDDESQRRNLYLLLAATWGAGNVEAACEEAVAVLTTLLSDQSDASAASLEVTEYITTLHEAGLRKEEHGEDGEDGSPGKRQCIGKPRIQPDL